MMAANKKKKLFPILLINSLIWALTIVVCQIALRGTHSFSSLFPVLAGGTTVSIVAVSISWKNRLIDKGKDA
jgi:hypothetical protein